MQDVETNGSSNADAGKRRKSRKSNGQVETHDDAMNHEETDVREIDSADGNGRAELRDPTGGAAGSPLTETFKDERDDVLAVINELEDQLDRYEEIREALESDLKTVNDEHDGAKRRVQELEWQVVSLQTRLDAQEHVRNEIGLLEEELNDANSRNQRLGEQISNTEAENRRIQTELKDANKELEELWSVRKERDGLRSDAKSLKARCDAMERAQKEVSEERTTLTARVKELQTAIDELRNAKLTLESDLRASEERTQELTRHSGALDEKVAALKVERKSLQNNIAHLERENARLGEQLQASQSEIAALRSNNRNAESALTNVKKAFSEVRVALSETKARARRRTIERWPRANHVLRGADEESASTPSDEHCEQDEAHAMAETAES